MPDLHPLLVHFPIALLTLYAVLEFLRFKFITSRLDLFHTKAILVVLGALGGVIAAQAGELAEEAFKGTSQMNLVEMHSSFAENTNILGLIIAALYIGTWIKRSAVKLPFPKITALCEKITMSPMIIPAAIALLIGITITGALGGAIVYGPDTDPAVKFIYDLLI